MTFNIIIHHPRPRRKQWRNPHHHWGGEKSNKFFLFHTFFLSEYVQHPLNMKLNCHHSLTFTVSNMRVRVGHALQELYFDVWHFNLSVCCRISIISIRNQSTVTLYVSTQTYPHSATWIHPVCGWVYIICMSSANLLNPSATITVVAKPLPRVRSKNRTDKKEQIIYAEW